MDKRLFLQSKLDLKKCVHKVNFRTLWTHFFIYQFLKYLNFTCNTSKRSRNFSGFCFEFSAI